MFVPGRIEFLGKHTDYCGGRSIVCAIDRGFRLTVTPTTDNLLELFDEDTKQRAVIELSHRPRVDGPKWTLYPRTVVERIAANFPSRKLQGLKVAFRSTLPAASGLSSSSAFVTSVFLAIARRNHLEETPEYLENIGNEYDLAGFLGCVENGQSFKGLVGKKGVGTFGGSQDHTAILCGKAGYLSRFSYCPVRRDGDMPVPDKYTFVIASSGVKAQKTGDAQEKYNRVSLMVSAIVDAWPGDEKTLAEIIESNGIDAVERLIDDSRLCFPKNQLIDRVRQFFSENYALMEQVSGFMSAGHFDRIGGLIDVSQRNAERCLDNQTVETVYLQRSARESGAVASSAFGAGFGGSVYALVETTGADTFREAWRRGFLAKFPQHTYSSVFFTTRPAQLE
jgi:galactokinase